VSSGRSGHTEAVEIEYDPDQISFEQLLQVFWLNIDPTVKDRQFCDSGSQYRTGIYFHNTEQQQLSEASLSAIKQSKGFDKIYTEIIAATQFYPAEDYHQDYYQKNPVRYKYYRYGCGRDRRLEQLWGDAKSAFNLSATP